MRKKLKFMKMKFERIRRILKILANNFKEIIAFKDDFEEYVIKKGK
jgi:hypothetical protein